MQTESPFNILFNQLGLSVRELARVLEVRVDSVISWRRGRRAVPEGVLRDMEALLNGGR